MPHPEYQGQALPVYSICPNWKDKVSLRTLYKTIIRESLDLSEERIAKFPRSLFGIQYRTLPLTGPETGYIRRVMELSQHLPVVMPVWTDACKLTVACGFGDNALQVETTFPTVFPVLWDYVIVWKDYKTWEILAVADPGDIDTLLITLGDEVQAAYPVGTLVMPILIGKMARPPANQITDEHGKHQVDFEERFHGLTDQSVVEEYNPLPELEIAYTDGCRAEFTITDRGLEEDAIYAIEVTDDPEDDESWVTHIYFALMGATEIASGIKVTEINNDYLGAAYFRTVMVKDSDGNDVHEIRTKTGQPLASVVAPPDLTLTNLTEITSNTQLAAAGAGGDGLRSLEYYSEGGFVIPYSFIEDPLIQTSFTYRRFKRKYGWRQFAWGSMGTLTTPDVVTGGHVHVVSTSGPAGATIKWTRDGSDPTLATPAPLAYQGVANNAYVSDHPFAGILKARCFKDGCRSPLTMIAIDKVMFELPVITVNAQANDANGYCDLPYGTPASETSNGCTYLWGGPSGFEAHMISTFQVPNYGVTERDTVNGPKLLWAVINAADTTYIGLPIHSVGVQFFEHFGSTWLGHFNGWFEAGVSHNWAETNLGVIRADIDVTLVGTSDAQRIAWAADRDIFINDYLFDLGDVRPSFLLRLSRYDLIRSPLYYDEMRNAFWTAPDLTGIVDVPFDPPPPTVTARPHEEFTTYANGDASLITMDYHNGTDWDASWVVRAGLVNNVGYDLWDGYADGAVPDHNAAPEPEYVPYDLGEGWYFDPLTVVGDEWVFSTPELGRSYYDLFTTYADGAAPSNMHDGYGWQAGENWVTDSSLIEGNEKWDGYADGAFVGAITGTNWMATAWVER